MGLAIGAVLLLAACGGTSPLLHPAHTLPADRMSAGAGVGARFLAGDVSDAIARQEATAEPAIGQGTAAYAALAPELSPYAALRIGLGQDMEGGLAFTGRSVRADLRHAWSDRQLALSAGAGASALFTQQASQESYLNVGGVDAGATTGWGLDVPVLVGIRSTARLIEFWAGPRASYQYSVTSFGVFVPLETEPSRAPTPHAKTHDISLGAVVGLSLGLKPLWIALEGGVSYHWLKGTYDSLDGRSRDLSLGGFSLEPAAALRTEF